MVGWGRKYEESPEGSPKRNPILSSCMTNEASPIQWKFQNCDMEALKKRGSSMKEHWECEKIKPPPGYENQKHHQRCNGYFRKAENARRSWQQAIFLSNGSRLKQNNPDHLFSMLDKRHKLYIVDKRGKALETCYNPKLLSQNGWCKLKHQGSQAERKRLPWGVPQFDWGICSSSCDSKWMNVSYFKINFNLISNILIFKEFTLLNKSDTLLTFPNRILMT